MRAQVTAQFVPNSLVLVLMKPSRRDSLQDFSQEKVILTLLPKILLFNPCHTHTQKINNIELVLQAR